MNRQARRRVFRIAIAFLVGFQAERIASPARADDTGKPDLQSVVDILAAEGDGAGILLSKSGRILTTAEFAASVQPLKCRVILDTGERGTFTRVTVVGFHPTLNLALLQIDPREINAGLTPAKTSQQAPAARGRVQVVLNTGTVAEWRPGVAAAELGDAVRAADGALYHPIVGQSISPSHAGGPVCDEAGHVIGIVTTAIVNQKLVALAVPLAVANNPANFVPFAKRTPDAEAAKTLLVLGDQQLNEGRRLADARGRDDVEAKFHTYLASTFYRQAVMENSAAGKCFYFAGDALQSLGMHEAAASYIAEAIDREPWSAGDYFWYRELGLALDQIPEKRDQGQVVLEEGAAKFPRTSSKIWEDFAVIAGHDGRLYDAAYNVAVALRVADQTTRAEVLQEIRNRSREHMSPADLQHLDQAEAKIDQMLRDRQDAADRARNAGQRYVNRACENLIATASRGFFQRAGGDSSKTVAAAPAATAATDGAPTDDSAAARDAVPSTEKQAAAMKKVKDAYGEEPASLKTADAKRDFAKKLLDTAAETKKDAAARFVLLRMARDYAIQAGDIDVAFAVVAETVRTFDIDRLELENATLAKLATASHSKEQHKAVAERSVAVLQAALEKDNLTMARQIAVVARGEAQKAADKALAKQIADLVAEIEGIAKSYDAVKPSLEALKKDPADAAANLAVGRYDCLIKGDWKTGLPLLAKGSDQELQGLANKELAGATTADDQVALGDAWWDLADKLDGLAKRRVRAKAADWYQQASAEITGLSKAKVERRLKLAAPEIAKSEPKPDKADPNASRGKVKRTQFVGGKGGVDFEDLPEKRALLVGFNVTLGKWVEKQVPFVWSIEPVYVAKDGNFTTHIYGTRTTDRILPVLAKPGYAVAGLSASADDHMLAGIKVKFMRIRGVKLDPRDTYESDWIGGQWGAQQATLGGDGKLVIGCFGRSAEEMDGIGLIQAE